ncbi:cytochrome P450 CYP405A2 [Danaus plexippus plexippus]|uniref:Cytochrome P450 CYP405A2 n=1 Tax=Danaus plexippus plexippus TaxID=278856 RepID=A0A212EH38_DANPL|nr:cytochrome P450 CYP405A2 [Danaus plexippus plexippus]
MWERHGKQNFRVSVGSEDWIMISDPDDVGALLNHPSELSKPLERNTAIKPFFGNSVSSSDGTLMGVDSNFLNNLDHPYLEANGEYE